MVCPKCGAHIARFDLKPNCKSCGVNLMIYTQEQNLIHDAKMAELEYAGARIFVAKLKGAFIDGKLQIIRMILCCAVIGALAVPFASVSVSVPLFEAKAGVGAIGAYQLFLNGMLSVLFDFIKTPLFSSVFTIFIALTGVFVLLVLIAAAVFVVELLSFINIKKTAKLMSVLSAVGIIVSVAACVLSFILKGSAADLSYITASSGFGGFACIIAYAATLFINYKIFKSDIKPDIKDNDILRRQTLKKIKRGEINIDDLPLPVFETPEEKEKRLNDYALAAEKEEGGIDRE